MTLLAVVASTSTVPTIPATGCPGWSALNPICQASSAGSSVAGAGTSDLLNGISQWVSTGAEWLLAQIGGVLQATTTINISASWFVTHYETMATLASVLVLPLLLLAIIQAVYRQTPSLLLRAALVNVPLSLLLTGVAVELVRLSLSATDAMCSYVSSGAGADIVKSLSGISSALQGTVSDPQTSGFVLLLGAGLVAFASFLLWVELLVRAAAVYVAVLFLPLALISLVWPAISHWCRRLVETLAALILSKFVIVAILSLASSALASGTAGPGANGSGFSSVLAGGALLLLASFTPFVLLRLIPIVEQGAIHQLEGARHRVQGAFGHMPQNAASIGLRQIRSAMSSGQMGGEPGTGIHQNFETPGREDASSAWSTGSSGGAGGSEGDVGFHDDRTNDALYGGIPDWEGVPGSLDHVYAQANAMSSGRPAPSTRDFGPMPILPPSKYAKPVPEESQEAPPSQRHRLNGMEYWIGQDDMGPTIRCRPVPKSDDQMGTGDE